MYYLYKSKNKKKIKLIEDNFNVVERHHDDIYFSITTKQLRKLKIFYIENNLEIIKIIKNSKIIDAEEFLTFKLSNYLTDEIDKQILEKIFKLVS